MSDVNPVLVWFRDDLRLTDNPALQRACETGRPVIAAYVLDRRPVGQGRPRSPGGAARWWTHFSLSSLATDLAARGGVLVLRSGDPVSLIPALAEETGARTVVWNRRYEAGAIADDSAVKAALTTAGIEARSFNGSLLVEPWTCLNGSGRPFEVFSAYWRACRKLGDPSSPVPAPARIAAPAHLVRTEQLADWALLPSRPDWAAGLRATWTPGEAGARARLEQFLDDALARYKERRDVPGEASSSALSPHLRWGEISPRQVWHAVAIRTASGGSIPDTSADAFLRELGWREFSYNLLFHHPALPQKPLRPAFQNFPWRDETALLDAWRRGRTGYPLVDAGMRQLWQTGWMHNRVRMVAASFLVKHLLQPWQAGEAWFWDTLVDADVANNPASWQWVAGCGADAAPYFRIFNPILQGQKFDGDGRYVRRYVPELAGLPDEYLQSPWTAPVEVLKRAGIDLGTSYPLPIVNHDTARERALAAFSSIKEVAA